ncbi:hypothetical protein GQ457_02G019150 [Hibiscus cannabinus]
MRSLLKLFHGQFILLVPLFLVLVLSLLILLTNLCIQTKLLITVIGSLACLLLPLVPLLVYGEKIEAKYHGKAVETGSLIVKACGFDSIPSEMGVMFNTRQWELPAVPNHVTAYVSLESDKKIVGNFATNESTILGVANVDKLQELRCSRPKKPRPVLNLACSWKIPDPDDSYIVF